MTTVSKSYNVQINKLGNYKKKTKHSSENNDPVKWRKQYLENNINIKSKINNIQQIR
jgi:hypothetical protein